MATYDPTIPPRSLQEVLAASPPATSVTGTTKLLTADMKTVEVQGLPFAEKTPAERAAEGDVTLVLGFTLAGGGYDAATLSRIAAKQAAGWPDSAILVRVMGVTSENPPDTSTGSISAAAVSLRPSVTAGAVIGVQVGSIGTAAVSLRPVVAVGSMTGIQEGVGVIGAVSVSLRPTVSAPSLSGVAIGSIGTAAVSLQPTVAAGSVWAGNEAPISVTLTPAAGATIIYTLDGTDPLDYIITDGGVALYDNGELLTTGDVR